MSEVADQTCAVVDLGVSVQDLLPYPLRRESDLVVRAGLRGEVDDAGDHLAIAVVTEPREDIPATVVRVYPGEA